MKNYLLILAAAAAITLPACSNDDEIEYISTGVALELPSEARGLDLTDEVVTLTNVSTGEVSTFNSLAAISVIPGIYNVSYEAHAVKADGTALKVRGYAASVNITSANQTINIPVYVLTDTDDLIIAELFYTKTVNDAGKNYNADGYVKLYNNTDHLIYADGITLVESTFATTQKWDYTPDIMNEAMSVWALYTVPGNGTTYPVKPGEYFIIADIGIDHRTENPYSFDLSHADVEWYDESSVPAVQDVDSPVPNMDKWYASTMSIWLMNAQSNRAYAIARIPVSKDDYLNSGDYWYHYTYPMVLPAGTFEGKGDTYRLPNDWIIDAVNVSAESNFVWTVTSPALDMGWAWVGESTTDKSKYFKSVRRKLLYINEAGHPVFKDTNNSSEDFNNAVLASEIELQGTVMNANGDKFTGRPTYDGVTPIEE